MSSKFSYLFRFNELHDRFMQETNGLNFKQNGEIMSNNFFFSVISKSESEVKLIDFYTQSHQSTSISS